MVTGYFNLKLILYFTLGKSICTLTTQSRSPFDNSAITWNGISIVHDICDKNLRSNANLEKIGVFQYSEHKFQRNITHK
jgi:hypothetical protein